jgi:hypothetical protein
VVVRKPYTHWCSSTFARKRGKLHFYIDPPFIMIGDVFGLPRTVATYNERNTSQNAAICNATLGQTQHKLSSFAQIPRKRNHWTGRLILVVRLDRTMGQVSGNTASGFVHTQIGLISVELRCLRGSPSSHLCGSFSCCDSKTRG